jgi:hypothetical protein
MWRYWLAIGAVPMLVLAPGCQATGMGFIPSALVPGDKASFGFIFDGSTNTLSGSYHDPHGQVAAGQQVDVAFKGTGVMRQCTTGDPACVKAPPVGKGGACLVGDPAYQSQNPAIPDTLDPALQRFFLLVCDLGGTGNPQTDIDFIAIQVETGPYAGYANTGFPSGNITVIF